MAQNGEVSTARRSNPGSVSARWAIEAQQADGTEARFSSRDQRADRPGLVATELAKSYRRRPVVRGVSLAVRRGEAVGLLGPNGAGKTTVFYMITGLIAADRGTISLDGVDITHLPMYQRARLGIGYLPQESSIFRGLTVEENILAVLEFVEPDRDRRESELRELLDEFSIAHLRRIRRLLHYLAESVAAWKSPAPSPPDPNSCSSTSLLPELTRSQSVIFATWCDSSRLGESGCLLRITTSEKHSNSLTGPSSSTRAGS